MAFHPDWASLLIWELCGQASELGFGGEQVMISGMNLLLFSFVATPLCV